MTVRRRARDRTAGFTLIETLVVMAVLAVVVGMVTFARPRVPGLRVDAVAQAMSSALRQARDDAMLHNVEQSVLVDADDHTFGRPDAMRTLPDGMTLTLLVAEDQRHGGTAGFTFYPDGQSSGGSIELAAGRAHARIDVDWLTGLTSMVRP